MNEQSLPTALRRPAGGQRPQEADRHDDPASVAAPGGGGNGAGGRRHDPRLSPRRAGALTEAREHLPDAYAAGIAYGGPDPDEANLDVRKYLWLAFKHRWLILGSTAVFVCLGLVVTFLTTPTYRASTTLQIDRESPTVVNVQDFEPAATGRDAEFYQTQYELLKSRTLAERVAANLALQNDATFVGGATRSGWAALPGWLFGHSAAAVSAAADAAARRKDAADRVLANLSVVPVRSSSIVKLSYDDPDPQRATRIANAIAAAYININLERKYNASDYARTFLQEHLQQLKQKLANSEKELVAYAEREKIVEASDQQTLAQTNLEAANKDYAAATTERLRAELLWRQVQSANALSLPEVLDNKSIEDLRAKRADLAAQYKDKLGLFKPAYPQMKQLRSQIDEIDRQIAAQVTLIKDSIKARYDNALAAERSLAGQIDKLKAAVTDFRNRNIQYTILQREVDTNRQLYDGLLQRYKEIAVAGGVGTNNISVVDKADLPGHPYAPRVPRNLAISLMLGLIFGAGAAFVREQLDDTFKSPEDLEEGLGLPLLGMIPLARDATGRPRLPDEPRSAFAEAYRSLRTALQFSTSDGVPKSLLVTSSRPAEGKSTTAATLARNFAELGMRVLLIDADLRKPSLHRALGASNERGLTNCLTESAIPPDVFQRSRVPHLTFMAAGPPPPNPAELLAGPKMLSLLTVAAEKYDTVIIDSPPVGGLADAPLLASMATGTLLLIDVGATRRGVVRAALKRLTFARAQLVGAVVNKVDISHQGYGYGPGYGYGYHQGYGDAGYYGDGRASSLTRPAAALQGLLGRRKGKA